MASSSTITETTDQVDQDDQDVIANLFTTIIETITEKYGIADEIIDGAIDISSKQLIFKMTTLYGKELPDDINELVGQLTQLIVATLYVVLLDKNIKLDLINHKNTFGIIPPAPITPTVTATRCRGTKKDGTPCGLSPKSPNEWCHFHVPKQEASSVTPATDGVASSSNTPLSPTFPCGGKTTKGTPCKRTVKIQGGRCYQHNVV